MSSEVMMRCFFYGVKNLHNESPRRKRTGYLDVYYILDFAASGGELYPQRLNNIKFGFLLPLFFSRGSLSPNVSIGDGSPDDFSGETIEDRAAFWRVGSYNQPCYSLPSTASILLLMKLLNKFIIYEHKNTNIPHLLIVARTLIVFGLRLYGNYPSTEG
jgi:hypothetical protein